MIDGHKETPRGSAGNQTRETEWPHKAQEAQKKPSSSELFEPTFDALWIELTGVPPMSGEVEAKTKDDGAGYEFGARSSVSGLVSSGG